MDPLNSPPGWRSEVTWFLATAVALALCVGVVPLLPVAYVAGRWGRGADR